MELLRNRWQLWMIGACVLTGCSRGDRPQLGAVTGTVFLDEAPLPNVWVMFNPTAGGRTSMARTNELGQYELLYLDGVKGANIGSHKVVILTYNEDELEEMKASAGGSVKEPIPSKYNSQTTLTEDVSEGRNVIDFHLESK